MISLRLEAVGGLGTLASRSLSSKVEFRHSPLIHLRLELGTTRQKYSRTLTHAADDNAPDIQSSPSPCS